MKSFKKKTLSENRKKIICDAIYFAVDRLGLYDWRIQVVEGELTDALAETRVYTDAKLAVITINTNDKHISDDDAIDTGFHEVCEVLLAQYRHLYNLISVRDKDIYEILECERHSIIQRIIKLLKYIKVLEDTKYGKKVRDEMRNLQ